MKYGIYAVNAYFKIPVDSGEIYPDKPVRAQVFAVVASDAQGAIEKVRHYVADSKSLPYAQLMGIACQNSKHPIPIEDPFMYASEDISEAAAAMQIKAFTEEMNS